jgi:hypothetical protein
MAFRDLFRRRKGLLGGNGPFVEKPFWEQGGFFVPSSTADKERIETDFEGYVQGALKGNGPVFACLTARQYVFSEARFRFRREVNGRPGDLFGNKALSVLEHPWPTGTTGELLSHMIQDADLAGNSFWTHVDDHGRYGRSAAGPTRRLVRLRPDWVSIVIGSPREDGGPFDIDNKVVGFLYEPRLSGLTGTAMRAESVLLLAEEVAHYMPIPDPVARYRGMSWLTPIIREIESDSAAVVHKKKFFSNAAVPNMAIKFPEGTSKETFKDFVEKFKANHQGAWNAYKTLFLTGGADPVPLTHDFRQIEFNQTVGKGEARIASAAGVPASWVGFSEGLQGSSLNQGNFNAARRRFADGTIRPLWRMAAGCLETLIDVPEGAYLWYDDRDIAFLREDSKDRAEIMRILLNVIDAGIKAGFEPDAVVDAAMNEDIGRLKGHHTGLVSVQMQTPGEAAGEPADKPTEPGKPGEPAEGGKPNGQEKLPPGRESEERSQGRS